MGSRAADTLKEIEAIRRGLEVKLVELERRLPPLGRLGRRAVALAVGGGAGGTALWYAVRRLRPKRGGGSPAPVVVRVFPASAVPAAIGVALIWAAVRLYEARLRAAREGRTQPAPVRAITERRGAGAG